MDGFFQSFPYAAAALTCGFKASTADMVAQHRSYRMRNEKEEALKAKQQQQQQASQQQPQEPQASTAAAAVAALEPTKHTTDVKRNVAFLLYGALYQGMAQGEFQRSRRFSTFLGVLKGYFLVCSLMGEK